MSVFDDGAEYVMVSNSGDKLTVSAKAAKMSVFAANQMEIIGDDDDREIKLPLVKTEHLRHIIDWCEHHAENKPTEFASPLPTGPFEHLATAWENDFLRRIECDAVPPKMMSDVANAANEQGTYRARLRGFDPDKDVAVLKIDPVLKNGTSINL